MKKTLLNVLGGVTLLAAGFVAGVAVMEHITKKISEKNDDNDCFGCDGCCEPYDWESEWPEDFNVDENDEELS